MCCNTILLVKLVNTMQNLVKLGQQLIDRQTRDVKYSTVQTRTKQFRNLYRKKNSLRHGIKDISDKQHKRLEE